MTIIDVFEKVNQFFAENTVLNINKNFRDIFSISEEPDEEKAALICALEELEESKIIKSTEIDGEKYWVLYKPLEAFSQEIEINYLLASGISSVINNVCAFLENDADKCDPKNITDKDLSNLVVIASRVKEENLKEKN